MDEYFVGRAAELAVLDRLLREAVAGHGQLGVVVGPGWIGKTALIQQFLDDRQVRVRWVCADQDEAALPGGLLEQFGLAAARTWADPLCAGTALLAKLGKWAAAAGSAGTVLVVDDAQWGDQLSLRALSYALRRLRDAPLLALVAVRDDRLGHLPPGLVRLISDTGTRLELSGFDLADIRAFAERVGIGPVPPRAARRLLEHTGGVPLYVREVLDAVPRESLRAALSAPDTLLPGPKSLEARVLTALAGCSGPARHLVAAAAVLGTRCRLADAAALADLADPLPALEEVIGAALLAEAHAVGERCCEFPHASVRAAVYRCVGVAERAALHRQAARRSSGDRALAHRAGACAGTDAALARDLAERATEEEAAGRLAEASDLYLAAVRVAEHGPERDRLLQAAAGLLIDLGEPAGARGLAAEIAATAPSAERCLLLSRIGTAARDPRAAQRWLTDPRVAGTWRAGRSRGAEQESAGGGRGDGGDDVAAAAGEFALLLLSRHRTTEAAVWARRATEQAGTAVTRAWARGIAAECLARTGRADEALTSLRAELARTAEDDLSGALLHAGLGTILFWRDDLHGAARHLAAAEPARGGPGPGGAGAASAGGAGAAGAALVPDRALRWLLAAGVRWALADYQAGAWDEAANRAAWLVTLTADLDQDSLLGSAHAAAVYPAAARGRWDTAQAHADAAARRAEAGDYDQLLEIVNARAALAFARDDPEAVLAAVHPVAADLARYAGTEPALLGFWPLYAHALARTGRLADAAGELAPFAELARARGRGSAIAAAARVQGFIHAAARREDEARRAYRIALANLDGRGLPHEEALTRLDFGRFLRHGGQRRAARQELYAARAVFARLGAVPFAVRCDAELGRDVPALPAARTVPATGPAGLHLAAVDAWPAPLTARQFAVARAVAAGKSNQQVARDLYVTVKTVEYHVSQIFTRLGIDARADIAAALHAHQP